jgi:hypothetical protein
MAEPLQELIASLRKEAAERKTLADECQANGYELNMKIQDAYAYAARLHADKLEAALAAVAPAGAEQVDESRSPDGDGRFDGGCRIPNKAARQVFGPAAKNPSIEHRDGSEPSDSHATNSALPAGGETPETLFTAREWQIIESALVDDIHEAEDRGWDDPDLPVLRAICQRAGALSRREAGETPLQDGWQEIATAPKDGRVLLFNPDEGGSHWSVQTGAWNDDASQWMYDCDMEALRPAYSAAHQPTHWQPLPAPPIARVASPTQEPR